MNRCGVFSALLVIIAATSAKPGVAAAQSPNQFALGAQIAWSISSEFDNGDLGFGGRFSWLPTGRLGLEAEITLYPEDFPDAGPPFSSGRVEGLFGVTFGPTIGRLRPFARLRPGFVSFREAPEPFACILIYPPPLACGLASGQTLLALDVGAGIEAFTTSRTFLRVDVGDRLLRFRGPVFDSNQQTRDASFLSHDFRLTAGGGVRF